MIIVDARVGSKELIGHFAKGVARLDHLEFADAAFTGLKGDSIVTIGVERKALSDLLSSMQSGRLAGVQLPGMRACYDVMYLVVEGVWKADQSGRILIPRGGSWYPFHLGRRQFTTRELDGFINSLCVEAGVLVRETHGIHQTAMLIYNLSRWWSKKEHMSLLAIHKHRFPDDPMSGILFQPPSLLRRMSSELKGVGWKRSKDVADHFKSVKDMIEAGEEEWLKIPGIGKVLAKSVVEELTSVADDSTGS
jgi:ERCC4-type nuclease